MGLEDQTIEALEARIRTLLPEEYQDCYDDVQPVSMGSAGLKYGADGKVAWNDMWETFCDLAMAGGPPHKGTLLEPASKAEIGAQPDLYQAVVEEICRGAALVTALPVQPSPIPGWVRVECESEAMAGWLVHAITMETVSARAEGAALDLPAGPGYRVEKEIKNVITVIAKTSHYWLDHMWSGQHRDIANLFAGIAAKWPLIQPPGPSYDAAQQETLSGTIAGAIHQATGLPRSNHQYPGWLGLQCADIRAAIWMMRALVASNILARREEAVLFVPVNPTSDPTGEIVANSVARIHGFAVRGHGKAAG